MNGNKVNLLFICGCGMGTSTMMELMIKQQLKPFGIQANLEHTSLGQMASRRNWADIIVILKNLARDLEVHDDEHVIEVVNIMDSVYIAQEINKIVEEYYPDAKQS